MSPARYDVDHQPRRNDRQQQAIICLDPTVPIRWATQVIGIVVFNPVLTGQVVSRQAIASMPGMTMLPLTAIVFLPFAFTDLPLSFVLLPCELLLVSLTLLPSTLPLLPCLTLTLPCLAFKFLLLTSALLCLSLALTIPPLMLLAVSFARLTLLLLALSVLLLTPSVLLLALPTLLLAQLFLPAFQVAAIGLVANLRLRQANGTDHQAYGKRQYGNQFHAILSTQFRMTILLGCRQLPRRTDLRLNIRVFRLGRLSCRKFTAFLHSMTCPKKSCWLSPHGYREKQPRSLGDAVLQWPGVRPSISTFDDSGHDLQVRFAELAAGNTCVILRMTPVSFRGSRLVGRGVQRSCADKT